MKLDNLTIRGFLRFTDPVSIDLSSLPAGLVAICGPNGAGKTTVLEGAIAAVYREFASRGDLTPYATGKDSSIEATFSVAERGRYRARVNVDGVRRTTDAVLEHTAPDGTTRLLNDGKATTFDAAVRQHFPSRDLLLASAFAAQNQAGNFIGLKPAQRRELFGELLGLGAMTAMGATAKALAGTLDLGRMRMATRLASLTAETTPEAYALLDAERLTLDRDLAQAKATRGETQTAVADIEARLALMGDAAAAFAAATQQRARLASELQARQAERAQVEQERATLERTTADTLARLETAQAADLADIDTKLAGNATIQGMAGAIRAAVAEVASLDQRIADLRDMLDAATRQHWATVEQLTAAERELAALGTVEQQQRRATSDAALLDTVPCHGEGAYADCAFLANARQAQASLSALVAQLEPKAALADRVATLVHARDNVATVMASYQADITTAAQARAVAAKTADYAPKLEASEARVQELHALRARLIADAGAQRDAATARLADGQRALAERQALLADRIETLTTDLAAADADIAGVSTRHQAHFALQAQLTAARTQWDAVTATIAATEARLDALARQRQALDAKRAQATDLLGRLAQVEQELLDWSLLAKALGKDGLPELEIDAAGPTISAYTNELLEVCHGPRFSLELVTQVAKADGKGSKSEFTIAVTDNQGGGSTRDIGDLSGGEQVVVSEAFRNAIAVYVNQRSPMPVRTCWRDETTGALDPENAQRYVAMLRKVQEMAGFSQTLFITHNPDVASQADAQIRLDAGRATVALPPYALEAA
ncbi:SMC family ATPase [Luteitalea sp.]|uniref:AAA family ATPase n=1 Tax=Luteitalea sp. TaxID=2004800 RepID=UPI0025C70AA0|nr:SMC family ATPase [Luteitalea sp.]